MQPFTVGERIVVVAIVAILALGALAGAGVHAEWWGWLSAAALVGLLVNAYCSLYNVCCR